jgi:hypothetical protein
MIAVSKPSPLARWDGRFGKRRRNTAPPRPFAALGYVTNGPVVEGLIEVENLVLVIAYDETLPTGKLALRLAGFSATLMPWGVRWGGTEKSLFFKDMLLRPVPQSCGRRLNSSCANLIELGLKLDREIERQCRYRRMAAKNRLLLPRLWAGFRNPQAAKIIGDGPELAQCAQEAGQAPADLLAQRKRTHAGLTLFPLEWVSHEWRSMTAAFADLERFPSWQVFPLRHLPEDLQGYQDAAQFDFFHSRFRRLDAACQPPAAATQLASVTAGAAATAVAAV